MKKKFLLILMLIMSLGHVIEAQVSMGVHAGVCLSKMEFSSMGLTFGTDRVTTFTCGIPFEIGLSEMFFLQPELNFISKGGGITLSANYLGSSVSATGEDKINYIELPVLLKFAHGNEKIKLNIYAGPAFAYGISGTHYVKEIDNGNVYEETSSMDFEGEGVSRFDFSFIFGAGPSLHFGGGHMFLSILYEVGLTDMDTSEPSAGSYDDLTVKNNNFVFRIGYITTLTGSKPQPKK